MPLAPAHAADAGGVDGAVVLDENGHLGGAAAGQTAVARGLVGLVVVLLGGVALHPDLVNRALGAVQHTANLHQHLPGLRAQLGAVAVEHGPVAELQIDLAAVLGHRHGALNALLLGVCLKSGHQLLHHIVDVLLLLVHAGIFIAYVRVRVGTLVAVGVGLGLDGVGVKALDDCLELFLADGGHGVQQHEEAQQERHHVAIGVHPVCAALAAAFLFRHNGFPSLCRSLYLTRRNRRSRWRPGPSGRYRSAASPAGPWGSRRTGWT